MKRVNWKEFPTSAFFTPKRVVTESSISHFIDRCWKSGMIKIGMKSIAAFGHNTTGVCYHFYAVLPELRDRYIGSLIIWTDGSREYEMPVAGDSPS